MLGLQADGGRAKKRCGLEGLGLVVPPRVPVKVRGRVMLLLPVAKVTGRAVMVVGVVLVGRTGCGTTARRPGLRRAVRSILILELGCCGVFMLFVGFCSNTTLIWCFDGLWCRGLTSPLSCMTQGACHCIIPDDLHSLEVGTTMRTH